MLVNNLKKIIEFSANVIFPYLTLTLAVSYFLFPYHPDINIYILEKPIFITQLLMILGILIFLCSSRLRSLVGSLLKDKLSIILLAFISVLFFSTLINQGISLQSFDRLTSVFSILIIFIFFSLLSENFIGKFFVISAWVTIVASVLGVLQFYVGSFFAPAEYLSRSYSIYYALGFANLPSLFGAHQAIFLPLFWGLALINYLSKRKLWLSVVLIGTPAFILTFSRSAWLGAIIAGLIILFWALKNNFSKKFIFSTLAVSAVLVLGVFLYKPATQTVLNDQRDPPIQILKSRLGIERIKNDSSSRSRVAFPIAAKNMIMQDVNSFLFGLGVWGFSDNWTEFKPAIKDIHPGDKVDPHSTFLEILVSGGVLALILFIAFIIVLYKRIINSSQSNLIIVPIAAGFTALLVSGFFHTYLYTKYVWIIAGILFALIVIINYKNKSN